MIQTTFTKRVHYNRQSFRSLQPRPVLETIVTKSAMLSTGRTVTIENLQHTSEMQVQGYNFDKVCRKVHTINLKWLLSHCSARCSSASEFIDPNEQPCSSWSEDHLSSNSTLFGTASYHFSLFTIYTFSQHIFPQI